MTFYELNGLLGCEKPIFHLTTGDVQKTVEEGEEESQKNLYPSQTCGPSILPEHLRCFPSLVGGSGGSNTESLGSRPKAGKEGSNLEAS